MVIMCDVDNCINNLQEVITDLFNQRYGASYTLEDFHSYGVEDCLPKEDAEKMQAMYGEPGLYDYVSPLPGAQKALKKLIEDGNQVYIVTDAIPGSYGEKVAWIKRHFDFIDDAHIVSMKHKWLFRCDVMIEDKWENLVAKPYYYRICMDYPWNRSNKDYVYDVMRCSNWDEVMSAINNIYIYD